MRSGNMLVLFVALVMGGIAAFMAKNWIQANATVAPEALGTIVVASAPLSFGVALTRENVIEVPWSARQLPEGAFTTRDQLLKDGRRAVLAPVAKNEPILLSKVTGPGQRASLSALLEEGKRAVTVRVDDVKGVAGFVLPGDRVDVVLIRSMARGDGAQESFSDVLLQHVKVLAVDQLANERQETPTVAKAVTLEVGTEQAQKILLATNIGKLSLILRQQGGDSNGAVARRISESDLGIAEIQIAPAPAAPAAAVQRPRSSMATIEIVRGMKGEKYDVIRTP